MGADTARLLARRRVVARQVAAPFIAHPAVSAVLVFGSVALGQVDAHSDVDLLVVCRGRVLTVGERARLLAPLGIGWRFHDQADDNPLVADRDAGGTIDGIPATVHYQTAAWIGTVLTRVLTEGTLTTPQMPFRPYTLPGLLLRAWVLSDRDDAVTRWRTEAQAFPPLLKQHLLRAFMPALEGYRRELLSSAQRGLGPRVFLFFLDRGVDALTSLLYAINEVYDPADKRAEQTALPALHTVPSRFITRWSEVLCGPFDDVGASYRAQLFDELSTDVLTLAQQALGEVSAP